MDDYLKHSTNQDYDDDNENEAVPYPGNGPDLYTKPTSANDNLTPRKHDFGNQNSNLGQFVPHYDIKPLIDNPN
jgi:hypothetical protein